MTTADDVAYWTPCAYCGRPLDAGEATVCVEHGPIDRPHVADPTRPNLLGGMTPDAIHAYTVVVAERIPLDARDGATAWARGEGFADVDVEDYATRAEVRGRTLARLATAQSSALVEERRQRLALEHAALVEAAKKSSVA